MPFKPDTPRDYIVGVFAGLLAAKRDAPDSDAEKWSYGNLNWACRELAHFVAPSVSLAAYEYARANHCADPRTVKWGQQGHLLNDPDRTIFQLEHLLPVSDMIGRLVALEHNPSATQILNVIDLYDVVWILGEENKELNRLGYRSKRPPNPLDAYTTAGIGIYEGPILG
jgi:hypothetical protein